MKKNILQKNISVKKFRDITTAGLFILVAGFLFLCFEVYIPTNPFSGESITYTIVKGEGSDQIVNDLRTLGLIRSASFFKFYLALSFKYPNLQAGKYIFSPRLSAYQIAEKMATGDVVKNKIVIPEGWDLQDIGNYFESKGLCKNTEFTTLANLDYGWEFDFLKDKPKSASLEGYLFPDTYEFNDGSSCQEILEMMLSNFGKKLTPDLRQEIATQNKTVFQVVTMASIIEKEVNNISDKKTVSGILWKRISIGMPLQVDSTINYITGKNDPGATIKDTKIDSPYNTYKYRGLPKGPISNPGIDSITAALYPTPSPYLYYLSGNGKTIFSKTLDEQNRAMPLSLDTQKKIP